MLPKLWSAGRSPSPATGLLATAGAVETAQDLGVLAEIKAFEAADDYTNPRIWSS